MKLRAYSVYSLEGIIFPTDLKEDLLKNQFTILESFYKYLIVSLFFSHLGFWSGNLFLIVPFPDLCLLVPFCGLADNICFSQDVKGRIW